MRLDSWGWVISSYLHRSVCVCMFVCVGVYLCGFFFFFFFLGGGKGVGLIYFHTCLHPPPPVDEAWLLPSLSWGCCMSWRSSLCPSPSAHHCHSLQIIQIHFFILGPWSPIIFVIVFFIPNTHYRNCVYLVFTAFNISFPFSMTFCCSFITFQHVFFLYLSCQCISSRKYCFKVNQVWLLTIPN